MKQPDPDYSQYELPQLYGLLRDTDRVHYPERFAFIRQQIKLKGGDPRFAWSPPFWCQLEMVTPTLRIVRWLVGLEAGAVLAWLAYVLIDGLITSDESKQSGVFMAMIFIPVVCAFGIALMNDALLAITNRAAVEIAWLSALGLAPFSALLYGVFAFYFLNAGMLMLLVWLLVLPVGFYTPFVFLTMWIKYHFRGDEF